MGNSSYQWKSLYVSTNTIYIGNTSLSVSGGSLVVNGTPIGTVEYLTPNISYTGVFNGFPSTLLLTKDKAVLYTGNSYILNTIDKYWLAARFDTNDYDLSGTETLDLINIGGIQGSFRLGGKSETLLTDVDLHDIVAITENFYVRDLPALETFNANNLIYVNGYLQIDTMDAVNTYFDFTNLETIKGSFYYVYNNVLQNTPQFPALKTTGNFYIYYNSATQNTMTFDSLEYTGTMSIYQNSGFSNGIEFPALNTVDFIDINNNQNMTDPPTFSALEAVNGSFYFYAHSDVTTAPATPLLERTGAIEWYDNTLMVNGFDFSSIKEINGAVDVSGCDLDQVSVDYILSTLVSLDGTGGTTLYQNRTVNLGGGTNAIPSEQGMLDIQELEDRGCVVYHNSPP